jgi:hypothetical protein
LKFLPFLDAREYIHKLNIKSQNDWNLYCRGGARPDYIPSNPPRTYKDDWKGWGDWLGTRNIANQNRQYLPFVQARKLVHSLGLKSRTEWRKFVKSSKKPEKLPSNPARTYKQQWKGFGDWLGTGTVAVFKRKFRPFEEARKFARSLVLRSQTEWAEYCKLNKLPFDVPTSPRRTYTREWKGWGDWLGTGNIAPQDMKYRSFNEARTFVHSLGLHNRNEWEQYCKSGQKPKDIPYQGREAYEGQWKGWGDWLGTNTIATHKREFKSFKDAKEFVKGLKLDTQEQWKQYCKSNSKPVDIPAYPARTYSTQWKGIGDWLGTGRTRNFRTFEEGRNFARSLGLKNMNDWSAYAKSTQKPHDIPGDPSYVYRNNWKSWGDWLGTGTIAPQNREYLPFEEARKFVHSLGLKTMEEWSNYTKSGSKPENMPANPAGVYKNNWISSFDWLGVQDTDWSITKVKQLLTGLIESKIIFTWDEAVLYSLLLRKGLLNIGETAMNYFLKILF